MSGNGETTAAVAVQQIQEKKQIDPDELIAFTGTWEIDEANSDGIGPLLDALELNWFIKKVAMGAKRILSIEYDKKHNILTFNTISSMGKSTELNYINQGTRDALNPQGHKIKTTCLFDETKDYPFIINTTILEEKPGDTIDERAISSPDTFKQIFQFKSAKASIKPVKLQRIWKRIQPEPVAEAAAAKVLEKRKAKKAEASEKPALDAASGAANTNAKKQKKIEENPLSNEQLLQLRIGIATLISVSVAICCSMSIGFMAVHFAILFGLQYLHIGLSAKGEKGDEIRHFIKSDLKRWGGISISLIYSYAYFYHPQLTIMNRLLVLLGIVGVIVLEEKSIVSTSHSEEDFDADELATESKWLIYTMCAISLVSGVLRTNIFFIDLSLLALVIAVNRLQASESGRKLIEAIFDPETYSPKWTAPHTRDPRRRELFIENSGKWPPMDTSATTIDVSISSSRVSDDRTHIEYCIDVSYGGYNWKQYRRFREFYALSDNLTSLFQEKSYALPKLPRKTWTSSDMSETVVSEREKMLNYFVRELVGLDMVDGVDQQKMKSVVANEAAREFFGINSRAEESSQSFGGSLRRKTALEELKKSFDFVIKATDVGSGDGWELQSKTQGVQVYLKKEGDFVYTKGVGMISAPLPKTREYITNPDNRPKYDDMYESSSVKEEVSEEEVISALYGDSKEGKLVKVKNAKVGHLQFRSPFPLVIAPRDIVTLSCEIEEPNGRIIILLAGAPDSYEPVKPSSVRARLIAAGVVLTPAIGNQCLMHNIQALDPNGQIPSWVVNKVAPERCMFPNKIDKLLSGN